MVHVVRSAMSMRSVVLLALTLAACGGAAVRTTTPDDVVEMEEMRIVASRSGGELVFDSYDAGQLFERGTRLLQEGRCREAVTTYYDRIAAEFPTSRFLAPAMYNAGLCLHEGGELEASIPYYRRVLDAAAATRDGKHASLQLAQVLVTLERWEEARDLADRVLRREDLSSAERLEALARRAQALLGLEQLDEAERQARDALSYYRTRRGDEEIHDPYFAAAANYVLAETIRLRSEAIALPAADAHAQHAVLDSRARLVLDAQREYFSTIRFTDAHWAAAAGYRIGSMYDRLWHALMEAPIPPPTVQMNAATRALYEQEYRAELARHIQPLLRHAIRYWELTLMMVERTGVRTEWAERARGDLERMRALLLQHHGTQADPEPAAEDPTEQERPGSSGLMPRIRRDLREGPPDVLAPALLSVRSERSSAARTVVTRVGER